VNGFPPSGGHSQHGSSSNINADLLKAKEAELESLKRREQWMKAALSQATKVGFVWQDGELDEDNVGSWSDGGGGDGNMRLLAETIIKMKQERAKIQVCFVSCLLWV